MIYKTLETTPYKVILKIVNDPASNLHLLTDEENPDTEKLGEIWAAIFQEIIELDNSNASDEILKIEREISALKCKHDFIQLSVLALEFDYEEELANLLMSYGYTITNENYYPDLEKVRRESKAILTTVKKYENKLPKQEEGEEFKKINIDEVLGKIGDKYDVTDHVIGMQNSPGSMVSTNFKQEYTVIIRKKKY